MIRLLHKFTVTKKRFTATREKTIATKKSHYNKKSLKRYFPFIQMQRWPGRKNAKKIYFSYIVKAFALLPPQTRGEK
jgi:hypothetical protein